jgi:beta-carotene hydroxylase
MAAQPFPSDMSFRDATAKARAHENMIAWPTIVLCLVIVSAFWLIAWGSAAGLLSLWWAVPVNAFLAYAAYTPAHEAVHGNVHRRAGQAQSQGTWLNNTIGALAASALLHNFPMHQLSHLAHHAHTNDPERDPDHWMAVRGWHRVIGKGLGLIAAHYHAEIKLCVARESDGRRRLIIGGAQNALWVLAVIFLAWAYEPWPAIASTALAAWLGSALLAWAFDWLPHVPHQHIGRFKDTRSTHFPAPIHGPLTHAFFFQNYHHIHHLWPRVPFYRYRKVHDALEPYLLAQGVTIERVGR